MANSFTLVYNTDAPMTSFFRVVIWGVALGILAAAVAGAFGNGVVGYPAGEQFYGFLSHICHQMPTMSFWLSDHPLAICARCTGGYTGVMLGSFLFWRLITQGRLLKAYAGGLTIFFLAVLEALIHPTDDNVWRMISGLLGGAGAAVTFLCLVRGLEMLIFRGVRAVQRQAS